LNLAVTSSAGGCDNFTDAGGSWMRYEARHIQPISTRRFLLRLLAHGAAVLVLMGASLAAGMWGYEHYEHLAWRDAFLNSSMLLGGMGPVESPASPQGKVFAGCYALYAGLLFIASAGIILAPVVHRIMHRFHWDSSKAAS
jgi:hypothetical protein